MTEKGALSVLNKHFANLKLSTKLSLSFGMVFLAFISVIITASLTLSDLSLYQQDSFVRDLPATEGMATLSVNMRRMKTAVQMFILLEDPTGKDKAIAEIEQVSKENEEIVEQLKEIFKNDREMSDLLVSIERRLDNFNKRRRIPGTACPE